MKPTREQIGVMIIGLAEIYGRTLSPDALALYASVLCEYEIDQVRAAFVQIVREHKWANMPVPAEFVKALEHPVDAEGAALVAWGKVFGAIKAYSPGHSQWPIIRDEVTRATVASFGGWTALYKIWAEKDEHEFATFTRKDFINAFITLSADKDATLKLAGTMPTALLAPPETERNTEPERRIGRPIPLREIVEEERKTNPDFYKGLEFAEPKPESTCWGVDACGRCQVITRLFEYGHEKLCQDCIVLANRNPKPGNAGGVVDAVLGEKQAN